MTREEVIRLLSSLELIINALDRQKGEWIEHEGYDECNLCHVYTTFGSNYCPNCGAKMDGGK